MPLKRPVTLPQARRWPAAAKRRQSFCARMGGMRELLTGERAARDPASPINRALAAWDCDEPELLKREHVSKGIRMKITKGKVGSEAKRAPARKNPADPAPYTVTWKSPVSGRSQSSSYRTKSEAIKDARALAAEGAKNIIVSKYSIETGAMEIEWRKEATNPARKRAAPAKKTAPAYAVVKVGMRTPLAVFAKRSDAVAFGQSWADIHKTPVRVVAA